MRIRNIIRFVGIIVNFEQFDQFWRGIRRVFINIRVHQLVVARMNRVGRAIADYHVGFAFPYAACLQDIPKTFTIERRIQIRGNI